MSARWTINVLAVGIPAKIIKNWLQQVYQQRIIDINTQRVDLLEKNSLLVLKQFKSGLGSLEDKNTAQTASEKAKSTLSNDKENFETFLTDKSYVTIENALYKLWIRFPEKRADYLNATKGIVGFKEKNVRQLWLALAILTDGYDAQNKHNYLKELRSYTAPKYHFEARQIAFSYLKDLFNFDKENLKDLLKATNHQSWRFKKFVRTMVDELLKKDAYLKKMKSALNELNPGEKRYIETKLKG